LRNRGWGRFFGTNVLTTSAFRRKGNQVGRPGLGYPLARQGACPPLKGQRVSVNDTGEGRRFLRLEKGDRLISRGLPGVSGLARLFRLFRNAQSSGVRGAISEGFGLRGILAPPSGRPQLSSWREDFARFRIPIPENRRAFARPLRETSPPRDQLRLDKAPPIPLSLLRRFHEASAPIGPGSFRLRHCWNYMERESRRCGL